MSDLSNLASGISLDAAPAIITSATETAEALRTHISRGRTAVDQQLAEQQAAREEELRGLDPIDRQKARTIDSRVWSDKKTALQKKLLEATAEVREPMVEQLKQQGQKLETLLGIVESPKHLLSYLGAGTAEASKLAAAVQAAGHAELATLAKRAVIEHNIPLGSLVANRLMEIPKAKRPEGIGPDDLADALVGKRQRELEHSLRLAHDAVGDALTDNVKFELRQPTPSLTKIERGLRAHARAAEQKKVQQ